MRKKILVTGGAGYIGSHTVVELFSNGYLPVIIDNLSNSSEENINGINTILNTTIPSYIYDCTDKNIMNTFFEEHKDIYACIHFAAYKSVSESIVNPEKYYKNNIGSLKVLLDFLEKNKFKNLIFSSSCTVYGTPDKLPVDECTLFKKAKSPYAETKQKCEILINNSFCNSVSLRYFNAIGSHDSGLIGDLSSDSSSNLVPIITKVAHGNRKKLVVNGNNYNTYDGTCVRDYIHVQDLAFAHVKALDYLLLNKGKYVFNVGTGNGLSVLELIKAYEKVNKVKINYSFGPRRDGDVEIIYSKSKKIEKDLNWKPKKTLYDALKSAYKWKNE